MQKELFDNPNYQEIEEDFEAGLEFYTLKNGDTISTEECLEFLNFLSSLTCCEKTQRALNKNTEIRKEVLIELSGLYKCRSEFKKYDKNSQPNLYPDKAIKILKYALKDYVKAGEVRTTDAGEEYNQGIMRPMLIRQAIYFVIYSVLLVNHYEEKVDEEKNSFYDVMKTTECTKFRDLDYQKELTDRLGVRDKIFSDWKMYPIQDFKFSLNPNIQLTFFRNGHKRDSLLYVITGLINKKYPTRFIDVFGGSGAVTAAVDKKKCEILNEYDVFMWNFLDCISKDVKRVIKECQNLHKDILAIDPSIAEKGKDRVKTLKTSLGKSVTEDSKVELALVKAFKDFTIQLQEYALKQINSTNAYGAEIKELPEDDDKRYKYAAICYFIHAFKSNTSTSNVDISRFLVSQYPLWLSRIGYKKNENRLKKLENRIVFSADYEKKSDDEKREEEREIRIKKRIIKGKFILEKITQNPNLRYSVTSTDIWKYGKRLKDTIIMNEDFRVVLKIADTKTNTQGEKVEKFGLNTQKTVVYLDPPYFMADQYDIFFSDEFHLDLLDWMRTTKCNWIFSCKDRPTNKKETEGKAIKYRKGFDGEGKLIKDFKEYFKILAYGDDRTGEFVVANDPENADNNMSEKLHVIEMRGISDGKLEANEILITNFDAPVDTMDFYYLFWKNTKDIKGRIDKVEEYKGKTFTEKLTFDEFLKDLDNVKTQG